MTDVLCEWPDWLPGFERMKAKAFGKQKNPPEGIVIHSGWKGRGMAEYIVAHPKDSKSYHFAWSTTFDGFVQCVSMQDRAYHAGSKGNHWLSIALPGPFDQDPRSAHQKMCFSVLMANLRGIWGYHLKYWARHSDFESNRLDPGPGFKSDWLDPFGLTRADPRDLRP